MKEIKKYINNFLKQKEMNIRYSMSAKDLDSIKKATGNGMFDALATTFDYGYVKGYRAAMAEMKKSAKKKGEVKQDMGLAQIAGESLNSGSAAYKEQICELLDKVDNDDTTFFRQIYTMIKTHIGRKDKRFNS